MTFDKFTIKAQEVVQEAVNTAQRQGQQDLMKLFHGFFLFSFSFPSFPGHTPSWR